MMSLFEGWNINRKAVIKKSPPNPATLVLAGLLLLTLIAAAVIATSGDNPASEAEEIVFEPEVVEPASEAEETVFEPEVVELDEGSASLNAEYSANVPGFKSEGREDIVLVISANLNEGEEGKWVVQGFLPSTQSVDTAAGSGGGSVDCWYYIVHKVDYNVVGTFDAAACTFHLEVGVMVTSSDVLSTDCPTDAPVLDFELFHMAPLPEELVFTKSPEPKTLDLWTFTLSDVSLPTGIHCPTFVQ